MAKNQGYVIDNMVKYWCLPCDRYFIIGEHNETDLQCCPFCRESNYKAVTLLDDQDLLDKLGCLVIGRFK